MTQNLELLKEVLSVPTKTYQEDLMVQYLVSWLTENNISVLSEDSLSINNSDKIKQLISLIKLKVNSKNQEARTILIRFLTTCNKPTDQFLFYKNNLNNAIKDLIHENCIAAGIKTTTNVDDIELNTLFDQKAKAQIYWILKEIIINTTKHSKSETLVILFSNVKNNLIIKTKDDGIGISINIETNKRNGITNITNRVEILGGSIELLSHNKKGVEYLIKIPTMYGKEN